ncbi:uncharacterized protein CLUP02_14905 [Colletotrichum lupini]|uniref:Uncharacterized protein n=1 Tax=Colletotrichum lupini TaxID=145971 RepID=A0A9Q8WN60_9PEZI|nr:uncharacterized protein CLUP02_14905 [Colletotrichum lupini]UQC89376.1 hypothetical protein CLUP02_14905 [Colletotrichum lupini]
MIRRPYGLFEAYARPQSPKHSRLQGPSDGEVSRKSLLALPVRPSLCVLCSSTWFSSCSLNSSSETHFTPEKLAAQSEREERGGYHSLSSIQYEYMRLSQSARMAVKGSSPPNIHTHTIIGPAPHVGLPSLVSAAVHGARIGRMAQDPDVGLVHDPESSTPLSDAKLKLSWANLSIAQHLSSYPRIRIHATVTYPRTRQGAAGCLMFWRFSFSLPFFFFLCGKVSQTDTPYTERYSVESRKPCPISSSPMVNATVNVTINHHVLPNPPEQTNASNAAKLDCAKQSTSYTRLLLPSTELWRLSQRELIDWPIQQKRQLPLTCAIWAARPIKPSDLSSASVSQPSIASRDNTNTRLPLHTSFIISIIPRPATAFAAASQAACRLTGTDHISVGTELNFLSCLVHLELSSTLEFPTELFPITSGFDTLNTEFRALTTALRELKFDIFELYAASKLRIRVILQAITCPPHVSDCISLGNLLMPFVETGQKGIRSPSIADGQPREVLTGRICQKCSGLDGITGDSYEQSLTISMRFSINKHLSLASDPRLPFQSLSWLINYNRKRDPHLAGERSLTEIPHVIYHVDMSFATPRAPNPTSIAHKREKLSCLTGNNEVLTEEVEELMNRSGEKQMHQVNQVHQLIARRIGCTDYAAPNQPRGPHQIFIIAKPGSLDDQRPIHEELSSDLFPLRLYSRIISSDWDQSPEPGKTLEAISKLLRDASRRREKMNKVSLLPMGDSAPAPICLSDMSGMQDCDPYTKIKAVIFSPHSWHGFKRGQTSREGYGAVGTSESNFVEKKYTLDTGYIFVAFAGGLAAADGASRQADVSVSKLVPEYTSSGASSPRGSYLIPGPIPLLAPKTITSKDLTYTSALYGLHGAYAPFGITESQDSHTVGLPAALGTVYLTDTGRQTCGRPRVTPFPADSPLLHTSELHDYDYR